MSRANDQLSLLGLKGEVMFFVLQSKEKPELFFNVKDSGPIVPLQEATMFSVDVDDFGCLAVKPVIPRGIKGVTMHAVQLVLN